MLKKQRLQKIIRTGLVLLFTTGLYTSCGNMGSEPAPTGLMTDLLSEPEEAVITMSQPRFTWIPAEEEAMQTGYQVIVASSEEHLQNEEGDVWNSGKVDSGVSVSVPCGGKPLNENSSYWWKVRTWYQEGTSGACSQPQKFNTGFFQVLNVMKNISTALLVK